jgi:hypothetical protein
MKLTTDILPRALCSSCEEILRIERVTSILLRHLNFLWPLPCKRKMTRKRMRCQVSESRIFAFPISPITIIDELNENVLFVNFLWLFGSCDLICFGDGLAQAYRKRTSPCCVVR